MHIVDYDRGSDPVLVAICSDPLVQRSGACWLRILAITQTTHPCLITSCLATYSQFLDNIGMLSDEREGQMFMSGPWISSTLYL